MTWSPLKSGKTTFRAGYGRFTDWLGLGTYEQTLRLDGYHQQEVNIIDPDYPNPGAGGTTPPTNRYFLDPGLALPESQLANVGVDQMIGMMRLSATYTMRRGTQQLRGRNLNVPVNGVRPDPSFTNVIDVDRRRRAARLDRDVHGDVHQPELAPDVSRRDVHALDERDEHDGRVRRAVARRRSRGRVGAGRAAASRRRVVQHAADQEPVGGCAAALSDRHAVQHHDRLRHEQRRHVHGPAGGRRPQQRALGDAVGPRHARVVRDRVRPAAGGRRGRRTAGRA